MSKAKNKPLFLNYHQQQTHLFVAPNKRDVTRLEYELLLRKGCRPCSNVSITKNDLSRTRPWSTCRWITELMCRSVAAVNAREYNPKAESYGLVLALDKLLAYLTPKCRNVSIANLLSAIDMLRTDGIFLACVLPYGWVKEDMLWRDYPTEFFYPSGVIHTVSGALAGPYPRVGPELVWVDEFNRVVDKDSPTPRKEELSLVWEKSLK